MFLWPRIYSWDQFTLFNKSTGAVGYHWKWHFKVTFQACEDTGHCSWGNKQTAMLNVCYWTTGRAGAHASGTCRLVFVYAGFFRLTVGWEFQLLLSHYPSHCNDNSHSFSSISCIQQCAKDYAWISIQSSSSSHKNRKDSCGSDHISPSSWPSLAYSSTLLFI